MGNKKSATVIKKTIDEAYQTSTKIKIMEVELDDAKVAIKKYAKRYNQVLTEGDVAFVRVTSTSAATMSPDELKNKLIALDREDEFEHFVKVDLTKVKKELGETVFEELADIDIKPFNKVTFKPLK